MDCMESYLMIKINNNMIINNKKKIHNWRILRRDWDLIMLENKNRRMNSKTKTLNILEKYKERTNN